MKSGDYLSSQQFSASTFGVKELNFCVRNGNRWILFAIITAMVIYLCVSTVYIRFLCSLQAIRLAKNQSSFPKINNYIALSLTKVFSYQLLEARKNYRYFL